MKNTMKKLVLFGLAAAAIAATAPASAAIVSVDTKASGGGNEGNVLFNPCNTGGASGGLIGCLNGAPNTLVRLTSSGDTLSVQGGGQARVEASVGTFDDLTIDFLDESVLFDQLVFNVNATGSGKNVGMIDFGGGFQYSLTGNGNNFFTINFDTPINFFSFATLSDIIDDIRQIRIRLVEDDGNGGGEPGGGEGPGNGGGLPVPEPGALGLLGLGLAALGLSRRRRA